MLEWFNENVGFWSALLSIVSILTVIITTIFAWRVGMMPYKKKYICHPEIWQENGNWQFKITVINAGPATGYIESIYLYSNVQGKEFGKLNVSLCGPGTQKNCIILGAGESVDAAIEIGERWDGFLERYGINLNYKIKIEIKELNGKRYFVTKGFAVG